MGSASCGSYPLLCSHLKMDGDMVMKHYTMLHCEIAVDEEKTTQWYAQAGNWDCECSYCLNFLEVVKQGKLPGKVLNHLSVFGIPPAKATYVCCLNSDPKKPLYQFSYRIAGSILKDNTPTMAEDVRFCHETYPYGAPDFPEPHFDIEFYAELAWVIEETAQ